MSDSVKPLKFTIKLRSPAGNSWETYGWEGNWPDAYKKANEVLATSRRDARVYLGRKLAWGRVVEHAKASLTAEEISHVSLLIYEAQK